VRERDTGGDEIKRKENRSVKESEGKTFV